MAPISKPTVGQPGWNVAVDAVIDKVNTHDTELFKVLAGNPDLLIAGTITRDANGAATTAPVVWPDGRPGQYTATTVSTAFPGAVDAYTITYDGVDADFTYTQPAVTRDSTTGAVTARPAVTVA